jgi:hypothetical protein
MLRVTALCVDLLSFDFRDIILRNVNKHHDERLTVCCRLVITEMMRK